MSNLIFITQQLLALSFLIGCTFAPNLKTFAGQYFILGTSVETRTDGLLLYSAMRCLTAFFGFVNLLMF